MGWTVDGIALEVEAFSFYVGISVNIQSVIVNATRDVISLGFHVVGYSV